MEKNCNSWYPLTFAEHLQSPNNGYEHRQLVMVTSHIKYSCPSMECKETRWSIPIITVGCWMVICEDQYPLYNNISFGYYIPMQNVFIWLSAQKQKKIWCPHYDTKLHPVVRFQFWERGKSLLFVITPRPTLT